MKKFALRKQWIERLESMDNEMKYRCLAAVYEYFMNGKDAVFDMLHDYETGCLSFLLDVMSDDKKMEKRREIARQRRQEKARREKEEKKKAAEQPVANIANVATEEYKDNPELYIFDGFVRYVIATGDMNCDLTLPDSQSLDALLAKFKQWVITHNRSREITRLNTFRGLFKHAFKDIA